MTNKRPQLYILSGAGISAESGLATFRDEDGLWAKFNIEEVCQIATWKQNRESVHAFYNARRQEIAKTQPNQAHFAIAEWSKSYPTQHFTQNIDDLLEKAGADDVCHLHGKISEMLCTACTHTWNIGTADWSTDQRCPKCDSYRGVKPNVVFFGEQAPNYPKFWKVIENLITPEDTLLVMGTSGRVINVDEIAAELKCYKILNNLSEDESIQGNKFDKVFYMPATQAVAEISKVLVTKFKI